MTATYRVIDQPTNGTTGQDCGTFPLADLPERLRSAVQADPDAGEWVLPALAGGDSGNELPDLQTVVRRVETTVCGCQIQHDNSGVGHNWRHIDAQDIPADIREEIEGEIIDGGKESCEDFVGSNGLHYRWE